MLTFTAKLQKKEKKKAALKDCKAENNDKTLQFTYKNAAAG